MVPRGLCGAREDCYALESKSFAKLLPAPKAFSRHLSSIAAQSNQDAAKASQIFDPTHHPPARARCSSGAALLTGGAGPAGHGKGIVST